MLTFKNNPELKARLIEQMKQHAELYELAKGQDWENSKGCAVGCMTHSGKNHHEQYPELFGLPEWLAHLEDFLFENFSNKYSKTFSVKLLEAIPVGVNIEAVQDELKLWILQNELHYDRTQWPDVANAVATVEGFLLRKIEGDNPTASEWSAARSAAWSAAWSAAGSSVKSAESARFAAWSADSAAAESAEAAAQSAESAVESAVESAEAACERIANKLIELLDANTLP